jgi:hypothetical protein
VSRRFARFLLLGAALVLAACGRGKAPPVVLISVDTLRADHLPAYGYRAVETPAIDSLARDSILFETAYCQVPLTLPSHAVILTGLAPPENGVRDNIGFRLAPSIPTLASLLRTGGYATGAAVSSLALRADRGLDSGFDFYDDRFSKSSPDERAGRESAALLLQWLDTVAEKPPLLFLHLYEPHTPYAPPEPFRTRYAAKPYDGEIAAADAAVGDFVAGLKKRGLYDRALVIFLADHGEGLGDHGEDEHGVFLYREAIRVPLLVKLPEAGERASACRGRSAFSTCSRPRSRSPAWRLPPAPKGRASSTGIRKQESDDAFTRRASIPGSRSAGASCSPSRTRAFQYIEAPRPELYDLVADPGERHDLSSGRPDPFRSMRAELEKIPRVEAAPENATPEELEKLGSLGYLSVTRGRPGVPLPDPKDRIASLPKYKRLFELYYAREDERVLPLAAEILAEEPGMVSVWKMRAGSRERLGDLKGAAEDLESALARSPNASAEQKSEIVEKLARVLVRANQSARAERVLRDAIAGPFATDAMRLALSQLLVESGRADEAARVLPPETPSEDAATSDARGVSRPKPAAWTKRGTTSSPRSRRSRPMRRRFCTWGCSRCAKRTPRRRKAGSRRRSRASPTPRAPCRLSEWPRCSSATRRAPTPPGAGPWSSIRASTTRSSIWLCSRGEPERRRRRAGPSSASWRRRPPRSTRGSVPRRSGSPVASFAPRVTEIAY